ncbi:hypothetical protein ACEWY4_023667 [Coilia grayii]|uniref:HAT C-terminal dimerisation domain-containing protein n=1 Tax=Coilia grayii TaxID=363190 RepID=A0ABD1IY69_9TELE
MEHIYSTIPEVFEMSLIPSHTAHYTHTHTHTHNHTDTVTHNTHAELKSVITLIDKLLLFESVRLNPVEITFLVEYASTMGPALTILQAETNVQMGWLLRTLTLLITKLDNIRINCRYCKPLVDAAQESLQHRFADMLLEPEFIAAAILVSKFKTLWTSEENIIKLGMDYTWDHLEEDTSHQSPANGSSASDDEHLFASMKKPDGQEKMTQLEGYLASKVDHKDILKSYPAVCKLSLKLNTTLPASAACERLFSMAGLIFSPWRARLDAKNVENQLLLKRNKKYFSLGRQ